MILIPYACSAFTGVLMGTFEKLDRLCHFSYWPTVLHSRKGRHGTKHTVREFCFTSSPPPKRQVWRSHFQLELDWQVCYEIKILDRYKG